MACRLPLPRDATCLRIDIFKIQEDGNPQFDYIWILGWMTVIVQLGISIAPWIRSGDWGIFLITACGTGFALLTGSLRQWELEKWAGPRLNQSGSIKNKTKVVCLLRGSHVCEFRARFVLYRQLIISEDAPEQPGAIGPAVSSGAVDNFKRAVRLRGHELLVAHDGGE